MKLNTTLVKIARLICVTKKSRISANIIQKVGRNKLKIAVKVDQAWERAFTKGKKNKIKDQ